MLELERIARLLKERMIKADEGLENKPSILFCGMDSFQKKDLHRVAKKVGFKPVYSMKHPSIKVLIQISASSKIETDNYNTVTIGIEHFWFLCRNLS